MSGTPKACRAEIMSSRERDIQILGSVYKKAKDSLDRWEPIPLELTVDELDRLVSVLGRRVKMMEKTQDAMAIAVAS